MKPNQREVRRPIDHSVLLTVETLERCSLKLNHEWEEGFLPDVAGASQQESLISS
jgi:hypothetical protein